MGSSISAIYDDYDDYQHLCEVLDIQPVDIRDGFYQHEQQILKERGYTNAYQLYEDLKKQKLRDDKIKEVISVHLKI